MDFNFTEDQRMVEDMARSFAENWFPGGFDEGHQ